jgi:hypothetical protein
MSKRYESVVLAVPYLNGNPNRCEVKPPRLPLSKVVVAEPIGSGSKSLPHLSLEKLGEVEREGSPIRGGEQS